MRRALAGLLLLAAPLCAAPAWAVDEPVTIKCAYNLVAPTATDGKTIAVQCDDSGQIKTTGGGSGGDASAANQTSQITQETATATGVGAPADSAWSSGSGSSIAVLKGIFGKLNAALAVSQSGTWTVQPGNTANTTAWKVDGSAVTQPVSGTVSAAQSGTWTVQPGNTANTTAWKVDGSAVTQPVSIATAPVLVAGTAIIGKVGIDQTTPGTTNALAIAGVNSATALAGNGATGTGSLRVTMANDNTIPTGWPTAANQTSWQGATGSAPPANSVYLGANGSGATGGQLRGLITCDSHAKYDASDNGSITLVTGVSGRKVYVCGYILATGGTATNLKLREGSDSNCASNAADLTPAYQLVANDRVGFSSPFWTGLAVSTSAYYVCVNASAGNAHQAEIWYTIL